MNYCTPFREIEAALLLIAYIISSIYTVLALVIPYYNGAFLDILISKPNISSVVNFALFIIFLGFFSSLTNYYYMLLKVKVINIMSCEIIANTIKHLRKIPLLKYNEYNPTYLNQRINNDSLAIVGFYTENYMAIFLNAFIILAIIAIIYNINKYILILAIVFIPKYIFVYLRLRVPLFKASYRYKEENNKYTNNINEQYRINEEIKIGANFDFWEIFINDILHKYIKAVLAFNKVSYLFTSIDSLLSLLFTSGILIIGGIQIINGNMTIGEFTIVNAYFNILVTSVQYFFELGNHYQDTKVAYLRLIELYNIDKEHCGSYLIDSINRIEIKNLCHAFIEKEDLNFTFCKSNVYGIVGANGSGKTSLVKLMTGILERDKCGKVYFNDQEIKDIDVYNLRKEKIAMMSQETYCLNMSVRELLFESFGDIDYIKIKNKLDMLKLHNLFGVNNEELKEHLNKKLSELSGGEKQKILFLRAALKDAEIYILDEPTNNLDSESKYIIFEYIKNLKNVIMIVITHETEYVEVFDEILYL